MNIPKAFRVRLSGDVARRAAAVVNDIAERLAKRTKPRKKSPKKVRRAA